MSQTVESPDVAGRTIADAIDAYVKSGQPLAVRHIEIATWIVNEGLFSMPFTDIVKECDKHVVRALKNEMAATPSGRTVRRWAACRGKWEDPETGKQRQVWLWDKAESCSDVHAHSAAVAMQKAVKQDFAALKETIAGWNEVNPNLAGNPIQLTIDVIDT